MDAGAYYMLLAGATGFISIAVVPNAIMFTAARRALALSSIFLGFFAASLLYHWNHDAIESPFEAVVRAILSGAIPLVGGYVFWYFTKRNRN